MPPSPAYASLIRYGMVNEVTNVVRTEMTQASRLVFSLTRSAAVSETMTYELQRGKMKY